jgi:hypothetical protein
MKIILKTLKILTASFILSLGMFYFYYYQQNRLELNEYSEALSEAQKELTEVKQSYQKYKQVNDMEKTYFSLYNFMQGASIEEVRDSHILTRTVYPLSYFDEKKSGSQNGCSIFIIFEPTEYIVCQLNHRDEYIGDIYFSKINGEWKCEDVYFNKRNTLSCRNLLSLK